MPSPQEMMSAARDTVDHILKRRFAAREFSERPVSRQTMFDILDAARYAPSGANIQPWRVYVAAGDRKADISRALAQEHSHAPDAHAPEYQYYATNLPEPYQSRRAEFGRLFYGSLGIAQSDVEARARQTAKNYAFFGAPVGLIVTIDRRLEKGSWLDLGMFLQNILIAADAHGLQSCPQETFARYHRILREQLPITPEEIVVCGVSLGYARELLGLKPRLMPRVPVEAFANFTGFDDDEQPQERS